MGLSISVGMLADLIEHDEEGAQWLREDFAKLNGLLKTAGLSPHAEPIETDTLSVGTYGYSGLHYLRRCASHLQFSGKIPGAFEPDANPVKDALYARYGIAFEQENVDAAPGSFARASERQFDHLIMHSDAEGYYIPQKFDRVLIAGAEAYGWVGSSYALAGECERLAKALALPAEILADGEDLAFESAIIAASGQQKQRAWWPFKTKRESAPFWQSHAIAAMLCAKLHNAATLSIRTGAAMVFC